MFSIFNNHFYWICLVVELNFYLVRKMWCIKTELNINYVEVIMNSDYLIWLPNYIHSYAICSYLWEIVWKKKIINTHTLIVFTFDGLVQRFTISSGFLYTLRRFPALNGIPLIWKNKVRFQENLDETDVILSFDSFDFYHSKELF